MRTSLGRRCLSCLAVTLVATNPLLAPRRHAAATATPPPLPLLLPPWNIARALAPKPRLLPRRALDIDFAVLLMRTSYAVIVVASNERSFYSQGRTI